MPSTTKTTAVSTMLPSHTSATAAQQPRKGSGDHRRRSGLPSFGELMYVDSTIDEDMLSCDGFTGSGLAPSPTSSMPQHAHRVAPLPSSAWSPRPVAGNASFPAGPPRLQQRRLSDGSSPMWPAETPTQPPPTSTTDNAAVTSAVPAWVPYEEVAEVYGIDGGYAFGACKPGSAQQSRSRRVRAKDSQRGSNAKVSAPCDAEPLTHSSPGISSDTFLFPAPVVPGSEGTPTVLKAADIGPGRVSDGAHGSASPTNTAVGVNTSSSITTNHNALSDEFDDSMPSQSHGVNGVPHAASAAAVVPMAWRDIPCRLLSSPNSGNAPTAGEHVLESVFPPGVESVRERRRNSAPQPQLQQHPGGMAGFAERDGLRGTGTAGTNRGNDQQSLHATAHTPTADARRTDSLPTSPFHNRRAGALLDASAPLHAVAEQRFPPLGPSRRRRTAPPGTAVAGNGDSVSTADPNTTTGPAARGAEAAPANGEAFAESHRPLHQSRRPSAGTPVTPARRVPGSSSRGKGVTANGINRLVSDSDDDDAPLDKMNAEALERTEVSSGDCDPVQLETTTEGTATSGECVSLASRRRSAIRPEHVAQPRRRRQQHQQQRQEQCGATPYLEMRNQPNYCSFGTLIEDMEAGAGFGSDGNTGALQRTDSLLEVDEVESRHQNPNQLRTTAAAAHQEDVASHSVGAPSSASVNETEWQDRSVDGAQPPAQAPAPAPAPAPPPHARRGPVARGLRLPSPHLDDSRDDNGGPASTLHTLPPERFAFDKSGARQVPPRIAVGNGVGEYEEVDEEEEERERSVHPFFFDNFTDASHDGASTAERPISTTSSTVTVVMRPAQRGGPPLYSSLFGCFGGTRPEAPPGNLPLIAAATRAPGQHGSGFKLRKSGARSPVGWLMDPVRRGSASSAAHHTSALAPKSTDTFTNPMDGWERVAPARRVRRRSSLLDRGGGYDVHYLFSDDDGEDARSGVDVDEDSRTVSTVSTTAKRRLHADTEDELSEQWGPTYVGTTGAGRRGSGENWRTSLSQLYAHSRASAGNVSSVYSGARLSYGSRFHSLMPQTASREEEDVEKEEEEQGSRDGLETLHSATPYVGSAAVSAQSSVSRVGWRVWPQSSVLSRGRDDDSDLTDDDVSQRNSRRDKHRHSHGDGSGSSSSDEDTTSSRSASGDSPWESGSNFAVNRKPEPVDSHPSATVTAIFVQGDGVDNKGDAAAAVPVEAVSRASPKIAQPTSGPQPWPPSPRHLQYQQQQPPTDFPAFKREVGAVDVPSLRLLYTRGVADAETSTEAPSINATSTSPTQQQQQQRAEPPGRRRTPHPVYGRRRLDAVVLPSLDPHLVQSVPPAYGGEGHPNSPDRFGGAGAEAGATVGQQRSQGSPRGAGPGIANHTALAATGACGGYTSPIHGARLAGYAGHAMPCSPPPPLPRLSSATDANGAAVGGFASAAAAVPVFEEIRTAPGSPMAPGTARGRRPSPPTPVRHSGGAADRSGNTAPLTIARGDCALIDSAAANDWLRQSQRAEAFANERDLRHHGWDTEPGQDEHPVGDVPVCCPRPVVHVMDSMDSDEIASASPAASIQQRRCSSARTRDVSIHILPVARRWFMFVTCEIRWVPSPGLSPDERGFDDLDSPTTPDDFMLE